MKRRSFVKSSLLAGSLPVLISSATDAKANDTSKVSEREYYELRVYSLKDDTQQKLVEEYYKNAAMPAYNKMGNKPVGVFTEMKPEGQTKLYVLIPYKSVDDFIAAQEKIAKDSSYVAAAAAYLEAPATAPAYERIESSFFSSFLHFRKIKLPTTTSPSRLFELRRYESPGEAAGKKKIEMFNEGGEIDIFLQKGLKPVFFGESLVGENRPNLTYLLWFTDMSDHDAGWKAFGNSAEWNKLKSIPDYTDAKIISKITSVFLVPTSFSQI